MNKNCSSIALVSLFFFSEFYYFPGNYDILYVKTDMGHSVIDKNHNFFARFQFGSNHINQHLGHCSVILNIWVILTNLFFSHFLADFVKLLNQLGLCLIQIVFSYLILFPRSGENLYKKTLCNFTYTVGPRFRGFLGTDYFCRLNPKSLKLNSLFY